MYCESEDEITAGDSVHECVIDGAIHRGSDPSEGVLRIDVDHSVVHTEDIQPPWDA
jgi:hypothetical protein